LRILVPLDGTVQARRALVYARPLAKALDGRLMIVHSADAAPLDFLERRLERIARRVESTGVPIEWQIVEGNATQVILEAARAWNADLIAMATRKWSAVDRWLNNSTTDDVVRSSDVPVLVVPPDWDARTVLAQPKRIVVPLDGSPLSEAALDFATVLGQSFSSELVLLRVVEAGAASQAASEYLRGMLVRVRLPRDKVETHVLWGSPPETVARAAADLQADLIVMSTRGAGGIRRLLLGSVATATLERATVPLLLRAPAGVDT
jgi:nucleotide-binding universal stress UspA family protein